MLKTMLQATLDRFGRIVIPRDIRQRHGWRPGTPLGLRDGPGGLEVFPIQSDESAPQGWAWKEGVLVCDAQPTGDISDIAGLRDSLDTQRDRELEGSP